MGVHYGGFGTAPYQAGIQRLKDYEDNLTEDETKELEKQLETVKDALDSIDKAEKASDAVEKLPSPEDVKRADGEEVNRVKDMVDDLTENEKSMLGKEASDKLDELLERIAELERISHAPSIIEGAGQKWNADSDVDARFRSNAEFDEFVRVLVDNAELDAVHYRVYEGSTVVELQADYLKTLSVGEHTLSVVSQNGRADTTFTMARTPEKPVTNDSGSVLLWMALLFVSGGVLTGTALITKKKKESK